MVPVYNNSSVMHTSELLSSFLEICFAYLKGTFLKKLKGFRFRDMNLNGTLLVFPPKHPDRSLRTTLIFKCCDDEGDINTFTCVFAAG